MTNLIDTVIGYVDPERAFRRQAFRNALALKSEYHSGAKSTRLNYNWSTGQASADATLDGELQTLRDRSRDLNRNQAIAAGITTTMVNNVIHTGIRPQSQIDYSHIGVTSEQAALFQHQAERVYAIWSPYASADLQLNAQQIQQLGMRQIFESGEFLAVRRAIKSKTRPYMLALDIIEPDRLDNPSGKPENTRFGITRDDYGAPITYYIAKRHPGDTWAGRYNPADYVPVGAYDSNGKKRVFHLFKILRPGQSRGIPLFTPIMDQFKTLSDYIEAVLVGSRLAACFGAFVKTDYAYGAAVGRAADTNPAGQRLDSFEPGMIEYLGPGQDVTFAKPEQPAETFAAFTEAIFRMMGAAIGMPYEMLLKDFSKTNYSSSRAALLQAYRIFTEWQQLIIDGYLQPVWELLMEEAYLKGELTAPGWDEYRYDYTRVDWIRPGWAWVDPLKEAQAYELMERIGATSKAETCAALGRDWEAIAEQRAREKTKYEDLELIYGTQPAGATNNAITETEEERKQE